jgi:putative peptidoglycan lipid II flippase
MYWAVLRTTITVGGLSLVVKVVAMFKEGLLAYRIGTAPELDAFLLAYAFPSFFVNVLAGALATAFIPVYVRLRTNAGEQPAANFAASVTWRLSAALFAFALVLAPLCSGLIHLTARSFDDQTLKAATLMLYALMPVLLLNGLAGYWSGFLNARGRFTASALVPLATPAAVAGALLFFWDQWGIYSIVAGTLIGGLLEAVVLATVARRNGLPLLPTAGYRLDRSSGLLAEFLRAAGGNVLIGATLLVDQAMAAMLAPGSVSALSYGTRVTGVLLGLGAMALATALLPQLSLLIAERRFQELRALLKEYCVLTLTVTVPLTALLIGASDVVIEVLFERGSFGASDSMLVSEVLSMIAVRLIAAMQSNALLVVSAAASLLLNVVLNWILSAYLGVAGIALATTIVYIVACIFLWIAAITALNRLSAESPRPQAWSAREHV